MWVPKLARNLQGLLSVYLLSPTDQQMLLPTCRYSGKSKIRRSTCEAIQVYAGPLLGNCRVMPGECLIRCLGHCHDQNSSIAIVHADSVLPAVHGAACCGLQDQVMVLVVETATLAVVEVASLLPIDGAKTRVVGIGMLARIGVVLQG